MEEINPQFLKTNGGELVVLTRAEFDRLVRAAERAEEDAEDVAIFDARMAELDSGVDARLPPPVSDLVLQGYSLLKALRTWKDVTQMHLSFRTDLSQGYISDLESGRKTATPETLRKIAAALEVNPAWLETGAG